MANKLRIVTLALSIICLMSAIFSVAAFADESMVVSLEASATEVSPGETFTIAIELEENPGVVAFVFDLIYDRNMFELVGNDGSESSFPGYAGTQTEDANTFGWVDIAGALLAGNNDATGELVEVTVRAKDGASGEGVFAIASEGAANFDEVEYNIVGNSVVVRVKGDDHEIHTWDNGEVVTEPTLTSEGEMIFTCSECGETKIEAIPSLAVAVGDVNLDGRIDARDATQIIRYLNGLANIITDSDTADLSLVAADVNSDGVITAEDAELILTDMGHTYTTYAIEPSCTENGYTSYSCDDCGDVYNDFPVTALGHDYSSKKIGATRTEQGYTLHSCENCDNSYADTYTPALETVTKGWLEDGDDWYYYTAAGVSANGWKKLSGVWYYFDNGLMATGWVQDGTARYYMTSSGAMTTGWKNIDGEYYYFNSSGIMKTDWLKSGGVWYYMLADGKMASDEFVTVGSKTYYFKPSGAMATGWKYVDDAYYYFQSSGAMKTGWLKSGGSWYFLDRVSGQMQTGFQTIDNALYYFASSGAMNTGWKSANGNWYYLTSNGAYASKWLKSGGYWYWFKDDCVMAAGEALTIGGVDYSFDASGKML